jgi:hypothetical protein
LAALERRSRALYVNASVQQAPRNLRVAPVPPQPPGIWHNLAIVFVLNSQRLYMRVFLLDHPRLRIPLVGFYYLFRAGF